MGKIVRVRRRSQVTIPARIAERIGLREDDFLDFSLDEETGTITIRPARLVTAGTPEAEREERRAEADLRAGRTRVFDSPEAYAKDLLTRNARHQRKTAGKPAATAWRWVKGKTVDEALSIKNTDIVKELSLPRTAGKKAQLKRAKRWPKGVAQHAQTNLLKSES